MRVEGNNLTCWSEGCGIDLSAPLMLGFAVVLALLILGTLAAFILPALQPGKWSDLGPRMRSWWVIAVLVGGALLLGLARNGDPVRVHLVSRAQGISHPRPHPQRRPPRCAAGLCLGRRQLRAHLRRSAVRRQLPDLSGLHSGLRLSHRRRGDGLDRPHRGLSRDRRHRALGHDRLRLQYRLHRLSDAHAGRRSAGRCGWVLCSSSCSSRS